MEAAITKTKSKRDLSAKSLGDLLKLREKLGTKKFTEVTQRHASSAAAAKVEKRENKNRPREMSCKKQVSRHREVIPLKKPLNRDPRFDDLSGEFNDFIFQHTHSFLDEMRSKEKKMIHKQLKKCKGNAEKQQELKQLLNTLKQQEELRAKKDLQRNIDKSIKESEKELVKEGKKPYYVKSSEKRKLELAVKFKELQKSGGVDKFIMKRRKKTAGKEKKHLPKRKT